MEARRAYQAELDALEIWTRIARDDLAAADRMIDRFSAGIDRLQHQQGIGKAADQLLPGLRSFPIGDYLIFYQVSSAGVVVLRIIHGARQLVPSLFE